MNHRSKKKKAKPRRLAPSFPLSNNHLLEKSTIEITTCLCPKHSLPIESVAADLNFGGELFCPKCSPEYAIKDLSVILDKFKSLITSSEVAYIYEMASAPLFYKDECLEKLSKAIEAEKKNIDSSFDFMLAEIKFIINKQKHSMFKRLDEQLKIVEGAFAKHDECLTSVTEFCEKQVENDSSIVKLREVDLKSLNYEDFKRYMNEVKLALAEHNSKGEHRLDIKRKIESSSLTLQKIMSKQPSFKESLGKYTTEIREFFHNTIDKRRPQMTDESSVPADFSSDDLELRYLKINKQHKEYSSMDDWMRELENFSPYGQYFLNMDQYESRFRIISSLDDEIEEKVKMTRFSPDSSYLVAVDFHESVKCYRMGESFIECTQNQPFKVSGKISILEFTPDGKNILFGVNEDIYICEFSGGYWKYKAKIHSEVQYDDIIAVRGCPQSKYLISGTRQARITKHDLHSTSQVLNIKNFDEDYNVKDRLRDLMVTQDSIHIISIERTYSMYQRIKIWNSETGMLLKNEPIDPQPFRKICLYNDIILYTVENNGKVKTQHIRAFDVRKGFLKDFSITGRDVFLFGITGDSRILVGNYCGNLIHVYQFSYKETPN